MNTEAKMCDHGRDTNAVCSRCLSVGQAMRHVQSGKSVTLDRRKAAFESFLPGWWVSDGGGLADAVIEDGTWRPVD